MEEIQFYFVPTPIGNLEDMSLRALRILKEVDGIYCEDTRVSRKLFDHYGIDTSLRSLHEHNECQRTEEILHRLQEGERLALVSDAGMPGISDPGGRLLEKLVEEEIFYTILPGPSALPLAWVHSAFPGERMTFFGFFPRKKGEFEALLPKLKEEETAIFYESPKRIRKSLQWLAEHFPNRRAVVLRELTKLYESAHRGRLSELEKLDFPERGEMVLVLEGFQKNRDPRRFLEENLAAGLSFREILREGKKAGYRKNELYALFLERGGSSWTEN